MVWKIASLYIASVIGAGFASGQELVQFFARFGYPAYLGVGLATALLSVCGSQTLYKCVNWRLSSYNQMICLLDRRLAPYLDLLYTAFLLLGTAIMIAGTEVVIFEAAALSGGMHLTALLVLIPLLAGPQSVLNLNGYLVPLMVSLMGYVAVVTIANGRFVSAPGIGEAVPFGILYAGYNYGFALAVFAGIGEIARTPSAAKSGGLLGGLILGALIALVITALFTGPPEALYAPIPMLLLARRIGPAVERLYTLVIWLAMYTTALAHGLAVAQRLNGVVCSRWWQTAGLSLAAALFIAKVGFVPLIRFTYPAFGVIGLFLLYRAMRL